MSSATKGDKTVWCSFCSYRDTGGARCENCVSGRSFSERLEREAYDLRQLERSQRWYLAVIPGAAQLLQGRLAAGLTFFIAALSAVWFFAYSFLDLYATQVASLGAFLLIWIISYWDSRQGPTPFMSTCQAACPANVKVPWYVSLVEAGRVDDAVAVIRENCPLPLVCGNICTHPCELGCRASEKGDSVAIRDIKRYAAEAASPENTAIDFPEPRVEKRVAIIGAGPAGLSASYYLSWLGVPSTLFEAGPAPGGALLTHVPEFRIGRDEVSAEVKALLGPAAELVTDKPIEDADGFASVCEDFDFVLVATGAQTPRSLPLFEAEDVNVVQAFDLLAKAKAGERPQVGQRAVVIGGGDVAMDAARTLRRLGVDNVRILCLEPRSAMPAHAEEIAATIAEDVTIVPSTAVTSLSRDDDGRVTSLESRPVSDVTYGSGGRVLGFELDQQAQPRTIDADFVVLSIGSHADFDFLPDGVARKPLGRASTLSRLQIPQAHVLLAGDCATGPASVIEALGAGREAALRFYADLAPPNWRPLRDRFRQSEGPMRVGPISPRIRPEPLSESDPVTSFEKTEGAFAAAAAKAESARCLHCHERCKLTGRAMSTSRNILSAQENE